ncbi:MAG: acetyl-CoA carboxylase biotin carboxyl carrier protein [Alphaproteobacteria bacterium]|nr:acetyl-CoA carboxylase biotin carboxyl carrier protein [Alphaproteobacteria bacterium]
MSIRDEVKQLGALLSNGTKPKGAIDAAAIRELAELLTETGLTEIEIEQGGFRLRVTRQVTVISGGVTPVSPPPTTPPPSAQPAAEPAPKKIEGPHPGAVTSPMVGTVYTAPQPGAPAFVKIGDSVKEGDTLLIVEAMKTMNPIVATRAGKVGEICVSDGQPVEFGQTLLVLE